MYRHNSVLEILTMLSLQLVPSLEPSAFANQTCQFAPIALHLKAASEAPLVCHSQWQLDCLIHLDFNELQPFTIVKNQYQPWGMEFDGTIALQPSNPVFADPNQPLGLMPALDGAPLVIHFHQPRQVVSARLTGTQQITVRVFDAANCLVSESRIGQFCYLQSHAADAPANHEMQLQAAEIARVEIASEAPFLLRNLVCG